MTVYLLLQYLVVPGTTYSVPAFIGTVDSDGGSGDRESRLCTVLVPEPVSSLTTVRGRSSTSLQVLLLVPSTGLERPQVLVPEDYWYCHLVT